MNRLPVLLSLAVVAAAVVLGVLFVRADRAHRRTAAALAASQARVADVESQLGVAREQHAALEKQAAALDADLQRTRTELSATNTRNTALAQNLSQVTAELSLRNEANRAMETHVAGLERDLAAAQRAAVPPETLEKYRNTIADLERQLAAASRGAAAPATAAVSTAVFANRPQTASRVLSVGPSNSFVVVDYGADRGAAVGQRLLIKRGTDTVAQVLISDVRPLLSIAHVQPDSLRGVLHKGDSAVLTN